MHQPIIKLRLKQRILDISVPVDELRRLALLAVSLIPDTDGDGKEVKDNVCADKHQESERSESGARD
jgi:hypothetical protein